MCASTRRLIIASARLLAGSVRLQKFGGDAAASTAFILPRFFGNDNSHQKDRNCFPVVVGSRASAVASEITDSSSSATTYDDDGFPNDSSSKQFGVTRGIRPGAATSALLKISFDGGRFSGWSAANSNHKAQNVSSLSTLTRNQKHAPRSSSRRRNRRIHGLYALRGRPRSVEEILRVNLAKVYGNVDPSLVVVEGCSRLDKGVHAESMVALIYCLDETWHLGVGLSIPGKRLPHPRNSTDSTCFRALPMSTEKLGFTLNRMLPPDVRVMEVADVPPCTTNSSNSCRPFHPTLSSHSKTYQYHLTVGPRSDPTPKRRFRWHIGSQLNIDRMRTAADRLTGHRDFVAFRGAARGATDKRKFGKQETNCNVMEINVTEQAAAIAPTDSSSLSWSNTSHVIVSLRANRFLYKMMRFLVGAMVAVGTGTLELEDLHEMMETGVRHKPFSCAPPEGLILTHVDYGTHGLKWKRINS